MLYLENTEIEDLHDLLVSTPGILNAWSHLLSGVPVKYAATLPALAENPSHGVLKQLNLMNSVVVLKGGLVPLERLIRNAAYLSEEFPEAHETLLGYANKIAEAYKKKIQDDQKSGRRRSLPDGPTFPEIRERILFVNDMVSLQFLTDGVRTAKGVARLTVPRFRKRAIGNQWCERGASPLFRHGLADRPAVSHDELPCS